MLVSALAGLGCASDSQTADADANLSGVGAADSILVDDWPEVLNAERDSTFSYTGDAAGASPLFRVRGLLPRPAGGVYVANGGSHELLAIDAEGSMRWRAGGKGGGPEEFQSIGRLQSWRGDTLIAIDQLRPAALFWTASGDHVRTRSAPPDISGPSHEGAYVWGRRLLFGVFADERFAFQGPERVVLESKAGRRQIQMPVMAADTLGGVLTLIDVTSGWAYEPAIPGSLPIAGFAPMSAPLAVAVHPTGFVWARADRYEIVQFNHAGQPVRVFGVRTPLERVSASSRQSYLETSSWRTWFPVEEEIPFPPTLPAFDRTFVSSSGAIWARRFTWGDAAEEWIHFTAAPAAVLRVRFPIRVQIMTATADGAYGVWRDDLDVEHIMRYQFKRAPSRN